MGGLLVPGLPIDVYLLIFNVQKEIYMKTTTSVSRPMATQSRIIATSDLSAPERSSHWSTLADVCGLLQLGIATKDEALDALFQHRHLKSGQQVYGIGQAFEALYIVNAGYLKTVLFDSEGNERVVSFPMKGDLLGSDGICADRHSNEVVALTDSDVIVIPFKQLLSLSHACQELEHIVYRAVSRQIVRENINLAALGSLRSDARVARFLAMEADRHAALNYSSQSFRLRMTRREIGSYLGLTLETVSRSMTALDAAGIISVDQRDIKILKPQSLRYLQDTSSNRVKKSRADVVSKFPAGSHKTIPSGIVKAHSPWGALQPAG
jgi:CRP/FNR family transcriptional regulator, anaerobic regulatory protein